MAENILSLGVGGIRKALVGCEPIPDPCMGISCPVDVGHITAERELGLLTKVIMS
jgi:hypothetical protein